MNREPFRIPLLRDRHTHPLLYAALDAGVNLSEGGIDPGQDPNELRSRAVRRIRGHAQRGLPGWAIAYGWNSGRYALSQREFDDLSPVVILNLSLHGLIVNDSGRALLHRHDPDLAANLDDQGWVERNLRGLLNVFATEGASPERLRRFFRQLLEEHGVYHAEEMLLVDQREIHLFAESGLVGRTGFWAAPDQYDHLPPALQEMVHGIKLFADGALGTQTAALRRPYRGSDQSGLLLHKRGELENLLRRYLHVGKPIAVHAIGDRAIDQAVAAVEAVELRGEGKLRIEHAQLITEAAARRAKALGIQLCMQPNFSDDSVHYADRLPEGYPERNNPFRMLIDEVGYVPGRDLVFGSDGMPHGAREGLRQSLFPPYEGQTLTVDEFVAGYCLPDCGPGHIEVQIDPGNRQVTCRVVFQGR